MQTDCQEHLLQGFVLTKAKNRIQVNVNNTPLWCELGADILEEPPVVGDAVLIQQVEADYGLLASVLPRRTKLSRRAAAPMPGAYPREQVMAANVDLVVPVFAAANPTLKWNLVDRYIILAEAAEIPVLICITKTDQLDKIQRAKRAVYEENLALYRSIGYEIIETSSLTGSGIKTLAERMNGHTSILMGKSGVGKTSLLNRILPGQDLKVKAVGTQRDGKGRHTTTAMTAYPVDSKSYVIDAPGIRELGLWDVYPEDLAYYFPEMRPYLGCCKFRLDCQHEEEPGCAVRQAVMDGKINPYRYQSYLRLKEDDDV